MNMNMDLTAARQKMVAVALVLGAGVLVWAVIVHHLGAPALPLHCVPPDHPVTSWYPDSQLWRAQIPGPTDGARLGPLVRLNGDRRLRGVADHHDRRPVGAGTGPAGPSWVRKDAPGRVRFSR